MRNTVAKRITKTTKALLGSSCTPGDIRKAKRDYVRSDNGQYPKFKTSKRQLRLQEQRNRGEEAGKSAVKKMKENMPTGYMDAIRRATE